MRDVILYGELAKRFGKHHKFSVKNAQEAIRALSVNFQGFRNYMMGAHLDGVGFKVFVGGSKLEKYDELQNPSGANEAIRIAPILVGSGGGWVRIFIGAVLVVGGIIVSGASFGAAAPIGTAMISAGAGLIIGGVAQLLTSTPKQPDYQDGRGQQKESFIFNGPVNTSVQGASVTLVYGRMIVGSKVISAGIESYEQA